VKITRPGGSAGGGCTIGLLVSVHTALAWLLSQHAYLDDPLPLLLKLWVHPSSFVGQEVEGGGGERNLVFVAAPRAQGRSTQGRCALLSVGLAVSLFCEYPLAVV